MKDRETLLPRLGGQPRVWRGWRPTADLSTAGNGWELKSGCEIRGVSRLTQFEQRLLDFAEHGRVVDRGRHRPKGRVVVHNTAV